MPSRRRLSEILQALFALIIISHHHGRGCAIITIALDATDLATYLDPPPWVSCSCCSCTRVRPPQELFDVGRVQGGHDLLVGIELFLLFVLVPLYSSCEGLNHVNFFFSTKNSILILM